jgi:hypothetical protein
MEKAMKVRPDKPLVKAIWNVFRRNKTKPKPALIALVGTLKALMAGMYELPEDEIVVTITHETKASQKVLLTAGDHDLQ